VDESPRDEFLDNVFPFELPTSSVPTDVSDILDQQAACANLSAATYPTAPVHLLRYSTLQPTWFVPGTFYSYSNYGYWLLGWVVEGASCRGCESFVREFILKPIGAHDTEVGDTERRLRKVNEAPYYGEYWPWEREGWRETVMQSRHTSTGSAPGYDHPDTGLEYVPYARKNVRLEAASGGWVSSAYDLALLMRDLFVGPSKILNEAWSTVAILPATYTNEAETERQTLSGLDWAGATHGKSGHMDGAHANISNFGDRRAFPDSSNVSVIVLFNRYYDSSEGEDKETEAVEPVDTSTLRKRLVLLRSTLKQRLSVIRDWDSDDLFTS
jgi:CubicO group peptidase (beta-lactamase class C family)